MHRTMRVDFVAEQYSMRMPNSSWAGQHLDHVAPHAERAAGEVDVVALVLDVDELEEDLGRGGRVSPLRT